MVSTGEAFTFIGRREGFDRVSGDFVEDIYRGTQSSIRGIAVAQQAAGADRTFIEPASNKGYWQVSVRWNLIPEQQGSETPSVEFRMDPGRTHNGILQPPYIGIDNISEANLREIRRAIKNDDQPTFDGGSSDALSQQLYVLLLEETEYSVVYRPTFSLLRTASSLYNWSSQSSSVGSVFLNTSVISEVTSIAGSSPNFELVQETFTNVVEPNYHYGWLKHQPSYDTVVGNKTSESIDWEYGLWPEAIYGLPA